jgi:hypothetical protein
VEWVRIVAEAHCWLASRWDEELGGTPWISENRLYRLLKKAFEGLEVLQHAEPLWMAPQHLDIHMPEISLAVEYMGEQHYRPLDFFGGEEAFQATRRRDELKLSKCSTVGVTLVYVRFDEDLDSRAREIDEQYLPRWRARHEGGRRGKSCTSQPAVRAEQLRRADAEGRRGSR